MESVPLAWGAKNRISGMICKRFLLQWPKLKKQHDAFAAVVLFFDYGL